MESASLRFVGFGIAVALVVALHPSLRWRKFVLVIANALFLAAILPDWHAFVPLAGFLALGYLAIRVSKSGQAFAVPVIVIVGVFVWLKKYSFVPRSLDLSSAYDTIGLSYILFRVLHLVIDARQQVQSPQMTVSDYLNYCLSFTTLVSGPIQRSQEFLKQWHQRMPLTIWDVGCAIERIVRGYFKTAVLALLLSQGRAVALANVMHGAAPRVVWSAILFAGYPVFLYCNFSGYIDIVIGISGLFGIVLPENFNRPFSADNFISFWSRWHITLSDWLKTYVYNPQLLMLMRRFPGPVLEPFWGVAAFFTTFFLVGLWHGQTPAFLFFGVLTGGGIAVNKLYQLGVARALGRRGYKDLSRNGVYVAFARGLTFAWFALTLQWFWSEWQQLGSIYNALGWSAAAATWAAIFLGATAVLAAWNAARSAVLAIACWGTPVFLSRYWRTAWNTALVVVAGIVGLVLHRPAPEIVYKNF
jgi:alginate O-acetyltransferase complex protein AlgI